MNRSIIFLSAFLLAMPAFAKSGSTPRVGKPYTPVIWELNDEVIRASLKCEIGQLAYDFGRSLPAKISLAQVKIKLENTKENKSGLDLNIPWFSGKGKISKERTNIQGEQVIIVYNISKSNAQKNCIKHNKFEIGVYSCLKNKLKIWTDKGVEASGSVQCSSSVNVKRVVSGSLGVKVWAVDFGPSGSSSETGIYTFDVTVPPKD
ncbi:hypothetical protein GOZ89_16210 [Agrobacterium vitis]|uniref:hypothetical protein n=1 Tax=Agrobacterium vitis TaxID=373 RepID=UPI0012E7C32D|nr:hypothetical protein [Agrobacterium vitis]MVA80970.1 hypothetical protein [Agrobacterium vitis]